MDNDEIAEEYCGSSASDRFGIALNQARQSERAEIMEMLEAEQVKIQKDYDKEYGEGTGYDPKDWEDVSGGAIAQENQIGEIKELIQKIKEMP